MLRKLGIAIGISMSASIAVSKYLKLANELHWRFSQVGGWEEIRDHPHAVFSRNYSPVSVDSPITQAYGLPRR